ncbi:Tetratricopeptide repeat protein [Aquisphaera giovannonii]|uniref:Tetratricopeptide repeat protein n=1 Tax=Aquisphaera giovannonii TaxID=406548 RepID=A0A5B9W546_9BACT|nr:tetratricopeptide repeat protein [Aquisphaera giovannonii]QEH35285.1 Tetratricopeptide repeat protein [Aquisphaera giovannonii]
MTTTQSAPITPAPAPAVASPRRGRAASAILALCAALFVLDAWWYWRDTRPVMSPAAIEGLMRREQYREAAAALRERLRRSPRDVESRLMLARTLGALDDPIGCARELHEVPFWWPDKPEVAFREGQSYLVAQRAKDAEACWLPLIKDDPLHPTPPDVLDAASDQLLGIYATEDRWDDAADVIWETYDRVGPDRRYRLLGMRINSELERVAPAASLPILERYVAADPTDWEALRARARALAALNRKDEAARDFRACLAGRPGDARAWRDYLTMLYDSGDQEGWAALLERPPAAADDEPEAWRHRGLLKEKAEDWEGALRDYRKALELNPYSMASRYRAAQMEQRLGHREAAEEDRKRADELRDARSALRSSFGKLLIAQAARDNHQPPADPDVPAAMRKVADLCGKLGWARLKEAYNALADRS